MVRIAVALAAGVYIVGQVRKPSRYVGRLFTSLMNESHSSLTDWGFGHIHIDKTATVLDVGCGGGRTIGKLAKMAKSVYGVDYAAGSVAASCAHNKQLIEAGQVVVRHATVSALPFPDAFFDLVTAIETQYYWPDAENDMREILRVLKPGGQLMIVAESYRGSRNDWLLGHVMRMLGSKGLSIDDHRALFQAAGYTGIEIFEERRKGWLCAIGQKPRL